MEPGDIVTLQDGILLDTYVATHITITSIDMTTDTILGTTDPGAHVIVWVGTVGRDIFADSAGNWVADFSVPGDKDWTTQTVDIQAGSSGDVFDLDDIWNITIIRWDVPSPILSVHPDDDWLEGYNWPEGVMINISIDDPVTSNSPDFTGSAVAGTSEGNPSNNYFSLDASNLYDIKAGDLVIAEYGGYKKEHQVTNLVVKIADSTDDTVSGTADPNVQIRVDIISDIAIWMDIESDADGNWIADFTGQYDLQPSDQGRVQEFDGDNDSTGDDWYESNLALAAEPTSIVPTSTSTLPAIVPTLTPTTSKPGNVILLYIVPVILIGWGIWYLIKRRKKE